HHTPTTPLLPYTTLFRSESVPAAAVCVLEPQPLFNPFKLKTTARRANGGFVLDGAKALVPRAADSELLIAAAELANQGPALFLVDRKSTRLNSSHSQISY